MMAVSTAVGVSAAIASLAVIVACQRRATLAAHRIAELEASLREAERHRLGDSKLRSLGMLAAGVAHEINNPMAYVTANIQMLHEDLESAAVLPDGLREYVDDVLPATLDGIRRVNAIVADLRSFSRDDSGHAVEFDLNAQLEVALRLAHPQLRHRAEVVRNLGRVPMAAGKPRELTQVFVNLIANAGQAVAQGGKVWVTTRADRYEHTVEIRDDGVGMAPEVVARLFEPFFTTKSNGTGLGLAVVHGIVRAHGGRIEVESAPGAGSTFRVHLPRLRPGSRIARSSGPAVVDGPREHPPSPPVSATG